jgi:hypothetical protein
VVGPTRNAEQGLCLDVRVGLPALMLTPGLGGTGKTQRHSALVWQLITRPVQEGKGQKRTGKSE